MTQVGWVVGTKGREQVDHDVRAQVERRRDQGRSPGRRFGAAGLVTAVAVGAALAVADPAQADPRRFTFTNEATTMPQGEWEYEQWVTWRAHKDTDSDYHRFEFRHEIEVGLTDQLQLAVYLADWRHTDTGSTDGRTEYRNSAIELKYNLTNPTTDPIGTALYGEWKFGPDKQVLEGKLIFQKNLGPWVLAYNVVGELEWERSNATGDFDDRVLVWENVFGVSYQVLPSLTLGAELLHEVEMDNFALGEAGDHIVWVGPNASVRFGRYWFALTPLIQITDVASEPNFVTRLLFGVEF